MTQSPKRPKAKEKLTDKEQSDKFIAIASVLDVEGSDFERAFQNLKIKSEPKHQR
jgi:hypothetical protein